MNHKGYPLFFTTRFMKFSFNIKITVLFFLCLFLRFFFVDKYLENEDSINFAMGLHDYDISLHQPHFPGYPVYIFLASLFLKIFHSDVAALTLPGVFFGSLTIFPLSFLTRSMFAEKTAILTAILYTINPLCWMQSERPASDTTGTFFILLSIKFLFSAFDAARYGACTLNYGKNASVSYHLFWRVKKNAHLYGGYCLFFGSLFLGIGLGVRLSYFPFVLLWMGTLLYYAFHRIHLEMNSIFFGITGLFAGICLWFIPQINYTGITPFFYHAFSFTHGHFTDWGGSVLTFGGWERVLCIVRPFLELELGDWRHTLYYLSVIQFAIAVLSILFAFRFFPADGKRFFCIMYAVPYTIWIIFGQNVANTRHFLPLLPLILMFIAFGLGKICEVWGKRLFLILVITLIIATSSLSLTAIIQHRRSVPASTQLIQYIKTHFKNTSVRIYCFDGKKRFFDYYLPHWDARNVREVPDIYFDLQSSLVNPETILIVKKGKNNPLSDKQFSHIVTFEGFSLFGIFQKN